MDTTLGRLGPAAATKNVVTRLMECLHDPTDGKRKTAAEILGLFGPAAASELEGDQTSIESIRLPVVVTFANLTALGIHRGETTAEALKRTVASALQRKGLRHCVTGQIVDHLREERMWLFLDALDEIEAERKVLLEGFIQELAVWKCRVVVTSRPYGWEAWEGLFWRSSVVLYRLAPLRQAQIQIFMERWFRDKDKGATALRLVQRSHSVKALAQIPFLLMLLCSVIEEHEVSPEITRTDLYEQALRTLFGGNKRARQWQQILEEVAWAIFSRGARKAHISSEELERVLMKSPQRPNPPGISDASQLVKLTTRQQVDLLIGLVGGIRG